MLFRRRSIHSLSAVIVMLASVGATVAHGIGNVGIYADPEGTRACVEVPEGGFGFLYLIATRGDNDREMDSGVEFRIEVTRPQGWSILFKRQNNSVMTGEPIDLFPDKNSDDSGAHIRFISCQEWDANGHIQLGTLFVHNIDGEPTELLVKAAGDPQYDWDSAPRFINCNYRPALSSPLLATSCTEFSTSQSWNPEDLCSSDYPFFVFGLNRDPDPIWANRPEPRPHAIRRETLVRTNSPGVIELPEGETGAPLGRVTINSPSLLRVLELHQVEWIAKASPCSRNMSDYWVITVPLGADRDQFIEDLSFVPHVLSAHHDDPLFPETPVEPRFDFVAPNPFVQRGIMSVIVAEPMPGRVEVFDGKGRRVRVLLDRQLTAGMNEIFWDGKADNGRRVASGVYFMHVVAGSQHQNRKLVFVR